jgi:pimeloyl-ACP methyl ester carboxylesterase
MNDFILSFHPNSQSIVESLAEDEFEVWTANLRQQGQSLNERGHLDYGFKELSLVDLPTVFTLVKAKTQTQHDHVHAVGCSLGASILFGYLAHHQTNHPLCSLVSIGGPLRWSDVHPLVKVVFQSPGLAGFIPVHGVRPTVQAVLPLLTSVPDLLSLYLNTGHVDLEKLPALTETIENPNRRLNRQIAHWMNQKYLEVAGVNVVEAMTNINLPLLSIYGNEDGVVPPGSALSIAEFIGSDNISTHEVGDSEDWYAHADLFIAENAKEDVFNPLVEWLNKVESQIAN